jgi:dTDP-4-amino-4,6-dideoxygalactose transaminase
LGTVRSMRLGALRPVGEPVSLFPVRKEFPWPPGYQVAWLDSGTSALGVALRSVFSVVGRTGKVVLPGYTCPDVVSAVLWAGGTPVLADTQRDTPWMDFASVADALRQGGVMAVIAPHFLGLAHPLDGLMEICQTEGVELIEDSAQLGPRSSYFSPSAELVALSFGRGKPAPVGGGALLYSSAHRMAMSSVLARLPEQHGGGLAWRSRMLLQNLALTRPGFKLVQSIPGLRVGETRYRPMLAARRLSNSWSVRVNAALTASHRAGIQQLACRLEWLVEAAGLKALPRALGWDGQAQLLRFPILAANREDRDRVVGNFRSAGLGASAFYGNALPAIRDMPTCATVGELVNAGAFAGRLLTLPCHSGVGEVDLHAFAARLGFAELWPG